MGQFSILYTYFTFCQTHWLTSINLNCSNWLVRWCCWNEQRLYHPSNHSLLLAFTMSIFWRVLHSNQFSSIYLALTRMVATERFGAGVLGAQSKEDIKLDYVIVGSWLLGVLVGIYYIYIYVYINLKFKPQFLWTFEFSENKLKLFP